MGVDDCSNRMSYSAVSFVDSIRASSANGCVKCTQRLLCMYNWQDNCPPSLLPYSLNFQFHSHLRERQSRNTESSPDRSMSWDAARQLLRHIVIVVAGNVCLIAAKTVDLASYVSHRVPSG